MPQQCPLQPQGSRICCRGSTAEKMPHKSWHSENAFYSSSSQNMYRSVFRAINGGVFALFFSNVGAQWDRRAEPHLARRCCWPLTEIWETLCTLQGCPAFQTQPYGRGLPAFKPTKSPDFGSNPRGHSTQHASELKRVFSCPLRLLSLAYCVFCSDLAMHM